MYSLIPVLALTGCRQEATTLFTELSSAETGIDFINTIRETDTLNMIEYTNFYTGAGVAVGDFNNDGLEDVFFGGNITSSRLYLNMGGLVFRDVTVSAGLSTNRWITGIALADVNQDGWLDIYLCVSGSKNPERRKNLLYINNGNLTFTEAAAQYGLDDPGYSTHAAFFDYDKDGDLDLFIAQNSVQHTSPVNYLIYQREEPDGSSTDKLYNNKGDGTFENVSTTAGIVYPGYSLGVAVSDINGDSYPDIFISNDFQGNDVLYINNGDGTFSNKAKEFFRHTSFSGMGNDVTDINGDGNPDILVLDMLAETSHRQKILLELPSYDKYQMSLELGYLPQYTRNTLQLNNGKDFSEIGQLAGIESSDWSWTPLFGDFDNDGDKDLFVTNGFLREVGDLDFITYTSADMTTVTAEESRRRILKRIASQKGVPLINCLFENNGDITFTKRTKEWGITKPTFSYGATYADLDNDGDFELLVNNSNDRAGFFKNGASETNKKNWLTIQLTGEAPNLQGIGAKIWIYTAAGLQYFEHYPYRGYLGTTTQRIHAGLGSLKNADSVKVVWPDGKQQVLVPPQSNQVLNVHYKDAFENVKSGAEIHYPAWFKDIHQQAGLLYSHKENNEVDFKVQPLLPHMLSQNGPGMAVGDVNNDNRDDLFVGGASGSNGVLFVQQPNNTFVKSDITMDRTFEDMGALFFDADLDGDQDLYVVSGGTLYNKGSKGYADRLYINDGTGKFSDNKDLLPPTSSSGSVVVGADYDKDGDIDLFVGGRVIPANYPLPPDSYLLRNTAAEKKRADKLFEDVTDDVAGLRNVGMVTAALWTDFDNDTWIDLIVVGEWMPLTLFKNVNGRLKNITTKSDLALTHGWWNSIIGGDFDNDGDIDYVAGNQGLNARFRTSPAEPLHLYAKDFDNDGTIDPVMCVFMEGKRHVPYFRGQLLAQIQPFKKRFTTYADYARTDFDDLFPDAMLEGAYVVKVETFSSSYFENLGGAKFRMSSLPLAAQVSSGYGLLTDDLDDDGNLDIIMVGNSYANDAFAGRDDAGTGICLLGNGKGSFTPADKNVTGFRADRNAKGISRIVAGDKEILVIANNNDQLDAYVGNENEGATCIKLNPMDACAIVTWEDGKKNKTEFYYGGSYLSQSSRYMRIGKGVRAIEIVDFRGESRSVKK